MQISSEKKIFRPCFFRYDKIAAFSKQTIINLRNCLKPPAMSLLKMINQRRFHLQASNLINLVLFYLAIQCGQPDLQGHGGFLFVEIVVSQRLLNG